MLYRQVLKAFDVPFDKNEELCANHDSNNDNSVYDNLDQMDLGNFQKKIKQVTLVEWVQENVNTAREAQILSEPYLNKIAETTEVMRNEFGIRQIFHNHKLSLTSLNNLMTIFLELLISEEVSSMNDRSLILGNFTGLDQNGRFIIDPFSPQENWKKVWLYCGTLYSWYSQIPWKNYFSTHIKVKNCVNTRKKNFNSFKYVSFLSFFLLLGKYLNFYFPHYVL